MSTVETKEVKKPDAMHVTYQACDMQPSEFIMDGAGIDDIDNLDITAQISAPSYRYIRRESREKVVVPAKDGRPETYRYQTIRYINGCHIVEKDEQVRLGIATNYLSDTIVMRNGNLSVSREGDIGLYDYLARCEYNTDAPNRPDDAQNIFKPLDPVGESVGDEEEIDLQSQALQLLTNLKMKGEKGNVYNEDALEFYSTLFKLPKYDDGFQSMTWVALAKVAKENPKKFVESAVSAKAIYEQEVLAAKEFGVISTDRTHTMFTDGNQVILSYDSSKTQSEILSLLVDFFSNPANRNQYDNLRTRLRTYQNNALGVIK